MQRRQDTIVRRWADRALVALFLLVIFLPSADQALRLDRAQAPQEKRVLAPLPKLASTPIGELPKSWEAYYNDHFGFRNRLVRLYNYAMVLWLHTSPSGKVILGRNGFLFYAGDDAVSYYRGLKPFSPRQLLRLQRTLEERRDWLARQGIHFLVVVAPSKETIYPEYMPRQLNRVSRESRLDQLLRHLAAHSDIEVLDLREPLRKAKAQRQVYYRTDTHWNGYGAFVACQEIMSRVARWHPAAKPLPLSAFRVGEWMDDGGDLATMMGLEGRLREERIELAPVAPAAHTGDPGPLIRLPDGWRPLPVVKERPGDGLPRAVVFRDSFAISLIPLLSEHFSRVSYLWEWRFDVPAIELEQPDVVILEIAERLLMRTDTFPPNGPVVKRDLEEQAGGRGPDR